MSQKVGSVFPGLNAVVLSDDELLVKQYILFDWSDELYRRLLRGLQS
jgi:hypothetical protein